jgi:hypothetical protein
MAVKSHGNILVTPTFSTTRVQCGHFGCLASLCNRFGSSLSSICAYRNMTSGHATKLLRHHNNSDHDDKGSSVIDLFWRIIPHSKNTHQTETTTPFLNAYNLHQVPYKIIWIKVPLEVFYLLKRCWRYGTCLCAPFVALFCLFPMLLSVFCDLV